MRFKKVKLHGCCAIQASHQLKRKPCTLAFTSRSEHSAASAFLVEVATANIAG